MLSIQEKIIISAKFIFSNKELWQVKEEYKKKLEARKIPRLNFFESLYQELTGKPTQKLIILTRLGYRWALVERIRLAESRNILNRIKSRIIMFWYQHDLDIRWEKFTRIRFKFIKSIRKYIEREK